VAIQAKLDEDDTAVSVGDRVAGLDAAIALYEQALQTCSAHADAMYNIAVATIEKLDCGCFAGRREQEETLMRCLGAFSDVVSRDTSGRAETSGLAHRAAANAIRGYFEAIMAAKGMSESDLIGVGRGHFDAAISILSTSQELDTYLLDYGRFVLFSLERLLADSPSAAIARPFAEKLHTGRDLALAATRILGSCLQTQCHSGIDIEVYIEASEVSLTYLQFLLSSVGAELGNSIPAEFTFCVGNLIEYEKALVSLNYSGEDETDTVFALKDIYEGLIKYFCVANDSRTCLRYCGDLITLCVKNNLISAADRGDCLFCIGMVVVKNVDISTSIARVSGGEKILDEELNGYINTILSYARDCAAALENTCIPSELKVTKPPEVADAFLQCAAVQYESCVAIALASASPAQQDDLVAFYFNLACIGWNLKDEGYCTKMLSSYANALIVQDPKFSDPALLSDKLRDDVTKDPDLRGVADTAWFGSISTQRESQLVFTFAT
jgi:hypothetical protein